MNVTRRSFLKGLLVAPFAALIPVKQAQVIEVPKAEISKQSFNDREFDDFSERFIRPAMARLADEADKEFFKLWREVHTI